MSDERLRELERQWKEQGTVESEVACLQARVRWGDRRREDLEIAAQCGHEPARQVVGDQRGQPGVHLGALWDHLERAAPILGRNAVAACISDAVALTLEHNGEDCTRLRSAILDGLTYRDLALRLKAHSKSSRTSTAQGDVGQAHDVLRQVPAAIAADSPERLQTLLKRAVEWFRNPYVLDSVFAAYVITGALGYSVRPLVPLKLKYESETEFLDDSTSASDPGEVALSEARLTELAPEICRPDALWKRLLDKAAGRTPHDESEVLAWRTRFREHLWDGLSEPAVVVSTQPLLVSAYTAELDCVVLLSFAPSLLKRYGLKKGSRLLTVNTFWYGEDVEGGLVLDLWHGEFSQRRYSNVVPLIADFLSDDAGRVRQRKREFSELEWERLTALGTLLARRGQIPRDGKPHLSWQPAGGLSVTPDEVERALERLRPA